MIRKISRIIFALACLVGLAGIINMIVIAPTAGINNNIIEKQLTENTPSVNADPSGNQTTQFMSVSQTTGLRFSGEILTCTKLNDVEQVDLRISNLDVDNLLISVDPLNRVIKLSPHQIKRIDLPLPYGVSSLILSSNDEKLTLQVPQCISRGGSSGFSGSASQPFNPPPPVPELSTIALTGIGVLGLIFISRRSKQ